MASLGLIITGWTPGNNSLELAYSFNAGASGGSSPYSGKVYYSTDDGVTWKNSGWDVSTTSPYNGGFSFSVLSAMGDTSSGSPADMVANGVDYNVRIWAADELVTTPDVISASEAVVMRPLSTFSPSAVNPPTITGCTSTSLIRPITIDITYYLSTIVGDTYSNSIYYSTNNGGTWQIANAVNNNILTITSESSGGPLLPSTTYNIKLLKTTNAFPARTSNTASSVFSVSTLAIKPSTLSFYDSYTEGNKSLTVKVRMDSNGGSNYTGIYYSTDAGSNWLKALDAPNGSTAGTDTAEFTFTKQSNGSDLVNEHQYSVTAVATTVAFPTPSGNTASDIKLMTPRTPLPAAPSDITLAKTYTSITVAYSLGSNGGSAFSKIYYSLNSGAWVDYGTPSNPPANIVITGLTSGQQYGVRLLVTTVARSIIADNTPSAESYITTTEVIRPSTPHITSFTRTATLLTIYYSPISFNGGSFLGVYYTVIGSGLFTLLNGTTKNGTSGTAPININARTQMMMMSLNDDPIYDIGIVAATEEFPNPEENPLSTPMYMPPTQQQQEETLACTFAPKAMSYTEYLRSKKSMGTKVLNTKPVQDASDITRRNRLAASILFAKDGRRIGAVNTSMELTMDPLRAVQSYQKSAGGRVGDASSFTAFAGAAALGGLSQAPQITGSRITQYSTANIQSMDVGQSASDYVRKNQGCVKSLGEQHEELTVTPPKFVDNTIRNLGDPSLCTTRTANHGIKDTLTPALPSERPSESGGQYAIKNNLQPGKELGELGGNPHYKAGAALRNIPYVEKHHGNDLKVVFGRVPTPYVNVAVQPAQLKINKPVTSFKTM